MSRWRLRITFMNILMMHLLASFVWKMLNASLTSEPVREGQVKGACNTIIAHVSIIHKCCAVNGQCENVGRENVENGENVKCEM